MGKLLLKLSLPATIGMFANGLYNLVDTIFIGRGVGTNAIGGITLAFPVQMILLAFGLATGQGAASVVSRNLGAGNDEKARLSAGNAFTLGIIFGTAILAGGLVFMSQLLNVLGAASPLRESTELYLTIVLLGAPFTVLTMVSNNLLRSEGRARASMLVMITGLVVNITLDPIFIFALRLGVAGAAWATVTGQVLSFMLAFIFLLKGKSLIKFKAKHLVPRGAVSREILTLGLPTFFRQVGQSVTAILLNNLLSVYGGPFYISAYGVVNRLVMFFFMPMFGMVQGFQPVAGFNYGAGLFKRVRETLKIVIIYVSAYMTFSFLLMLVFPDFFAGIFTSDPKLIETASYVIIFLIAAMPVVGIQNICANYFIVVGKSLSGLALGLLRQVIILIPMLLILPGVWGLKGVLLSFPVSDILGTFITVIWMIPELRRLKGNSARK